MFRIIILALALILFPISATSQTSMYATGGSGSSFNPSDPQDITGAWTFLDKDNLLILETADPTKKLRFELVNITTGTTRTVTFPDSNFLAAGSDIAQTFSARQTFSLAINIPNSTTLPATCTVGDIYSDTDSTKRFSVCVATDTWVSFFETGGGDVVGPASSTANAFVIFDGTTGKLVKNSSITIDANGPIFSFTNAAGLNRIFGDTGTVASGSLTLDSGYGGEFCWGNSCYFLGSNRIEATLSGVRQFYSLMNDWRWGSAFTVGFASGASAGDAVDTLSFRAAAGIWGFGGSSATTAGATRVIASNGSYNQTGSNTSLITLSTSGTTTNSAVDIVPANSIIDSIACRVTTEITTATDWGVSITGDAAWNQIGTTDTTVAGLTAGTTAIFVSPSHDGQYNDTLTTVTITTTGTPGAGAIRCAVHSRTFVAPTS